MYYDQRSQYIRLIQKRIVSTRVSVRGKKLYEEIRYCILGGFDRGKYSREETIQGRKLFKGGNYLFEEVRYKRFE